MSKPVDVVAVLTSEIEAALAWRLRTKSDAATKMLDANDALHAVAELIAADVEYDAAKKALDDAEAEWEWRGPNSDFDAIRKKVNAATDKFYESEDRRAAALAACKPATGAEK